MTTPTAGAALGNQLRAGTVAKVGSTKRIQELNGMLHANRPNVDITRARAYTKVYRATEGMPSLMRRYKASAEVYRTLTDNVYDYEQLVGWPTKRIRGANFAIELHAHWLADDLPNLRDRTYDPFEITEGNADLGGGLLCPQRGGLWRRAGAGHGPPHGVGGDVALVLHLPPHPGAGGDLGTHLPAAGLPDPPGVVPLGHPGLPGGAAAGHRGLKRRIPRILIVSLLHRAPRSCGIGGRGGLFWQSPRQGAKIARKARGGVLKIREMSESKQKSRYFFRAP